MSQDSRIGPKGGKLTPKIRTLPKWFGCDDVLLQEGETALVVLRLGIFVMVERPCVLESWCAEIAYECQSAGDLDVFVLRNWA